MSGRFPRFFLLNYVWGVDRVGKKKSTIRLAMCARTLQWMHEHVLVVRFSTVEARLVVVVESFDARRNTRFDELLLSSRKLKGYGLYGMRACKLGGVQQL